MSRDSVSLHMFVDPGNRATSLAFEEAHLALREELSAIAGVSVKLATGAAPSGAKAVDGGLIGLVIALGASGAVLPTVVGVVRDWLLRQAPATSIRIQKGDLEIEWSGTTPPAEVKMLIEKILARV